MKKTILFILFSLITVVTLSSLGKVFAAGTGTVVFHYHAWDETYDLESGAKMYAHTWGDGVSGKAYDTIDEFGASFTWTDVPVTSTPGFIAVWSTEDVSGPNWDYKQTGDITPGAVVREGETTHIWAFYNAGNNVSNPLVTYSDEYSALVVYYDPAGAYEEKIGYFGWGKFEKAGNGWGDVAEFQKIGVSDGNTEVKGALFTNAEAFGGDGFLIYAGGDSTKKTGDVNFPDAELGKLAIKFVVNAGDAVTDNHNVFTSFEDFAASAFVFQLSPAGTFAYNPTILNVKGSLPVANPYSQAKTEEERNAALTAIKGWFKVEDADGNVVPVESVSFLKEPASFSEWVLTLGSPLSITKTYTITITVGDQEASLPVNMDTEAPVIIFDGHLGSDVLVIIVEWGKKFDRTLVPRFTASDDRDGDVSSSVYIPVGKGIVDTRTEGDYEVTWQVEDSWGNVGSVTCIFRVVKSGK